MKDVVIKAANNGRVTWVHFHKQHPQYGRQAIVSLQLSPRSQITVSYNLCKRYKWTDNCYDIDLEREYI